MKRSFTGSPSVALKKQVGPTHRVRNDYGDTDLTNLEAVVVFLALVVIGGSAFGLYYLSGMA